MEFNMADLFESLADAVPVREAIVCADKRVSYAELRSGQVDIGGKMVKTAPLSSLFKARKIATELQGKILSGEFVMTQPAATLPYNAQFKSLNAEVK